MTDEGNIFRVDLRLRPEGRVGALVLSLDGYHAYHRERAELWERQALHQGARLARATSAWRARFIELVRAFVYRPGARRRRSCPRSAG